MCLQIISIAEDQGTKRYDFAAFQCYSCKRLKYTTLNYQDKVDIEKTAGDIQVLSLHPEFQINRDNSVLTTTSTEDRQTDRPTDRRTFFIIHFFGLLGPQNAKIRQNLEIDFLLRDNTFLGKVKLFYFLPIAIIECRFSFLSFF